jgi:hypothetical protein
MSNRRLVLVVVVGEPGLQTLGAIVELLDGWQ